MEGYLTSKEAAAYLKISTRTLRRWVLSSKVKAYKTKTGRIRRFKISTLDKVFEK